MEKSHSAHQCQTSLHITRSKIGSGEDGGRLLTQVHAILGEKSLASRKVDSATHDVALAKYHPKARADVGAPIELAIIAM
jgi:hypothetical protein